ALIGAFLEKKVASRIGYAEQKLALGGFQHALLNLSKFDVQHFLQLFAFERMENHDFVESVHKFRRKLLPRSLNSGALDLLIEPSNRLIVRLNEPHPALHQLGDFSAAEVRR